jgi:hypothetical protein
MSLSGGVISAVPIGRNQSAKLIQSTCLSIHTACTQTCRLHTSRMVVVSKDGSQFDKVGSENAG